MKPLRFILAGAALLALFIAPVLFLFGVVTLDSVKTTLLIGTLVWFAARIPGLRSAV